MMSRKRIKITIVIGILTSMFWYVVNPILNPQLLNSHNSRNAPAEDNVIVMGPGLHDNDNDNDTTAAPHTTAVPQVTKTKSEYLPPDVLNHVSISDSFVKMIPQSGAYWNLLFHTIVNGIAEGENKIRNQSWAQCKETSHEVFKNNAVQDLSTYTDVGQDFVRGMDCKSPPILINQPNKCRSGDGQTFLLFAIKSSPMSFGRRQAVRETWGKEGVYQSGLRVRTVFLLGSLSIDDPDVRQLLAFEAKVFGDVLQWDFHDTLFNLALKQHMFFKWSLQNCPNVSFVFDGDDDVFVNNLQIFNYLKSLEPTRASQVYVGQVITQASPIRNPKSKYYVPLSFYDGPYPPYAGGGGFLFSGALLEPLYNVSYVIPFFPIDDVFIGMCFQSLGISAVTHAEFRTFGIREQDVTNICVHKDLVLVHQRTPQQIKMLSRGINNPELRC